MLIKCSPSNLQYFKSGYPAKYVWDIPAQCGGTYKEEKNVGTFFFEAFPDEGFLRADSKISMEDAEEKAWQKYLKLNQCTVDHKNPNNLDRKNYSNGCAFCKFCGSWISSSYSGLKPTTSCSKCGKPSYYTTLKNGNWCCEVCIAYVPENELSEFFLATKEVLQPLTQEILKEDLGIVFEYIIKNTNDNSN